MSMKNGGRSMPDFPLGIIDGVSANPPFDSAVFIQDRAVFGNSVDVKSKDIVRCNLRGL